MMNIQVNVQHIVKLCVSVKDNKTSKTNKQNKREKDFLKILKKDIFPLF